RRVRAARVTHATPTAVITAPAARSADALQHMPVTLRGHRGARAGKTTRPGLRRAWRTAGDGGADQE
ncbi:hypothetical protein P8605_34430, partial [Streptomyces sp. T-3]|nr:hypothetical protein [Streptomyces sp. T-3]